MPVAAMLLVIVGLFFAFVGVYSANPMFERMNRPRLFRKGWGSAFFAALILAISLGIPSIVIWSFFQIPWYLNIPLLIGTFVLFGYLFNGRWLRFVHNALALIVAAQALIVVHYTAWYWVDW